MEFNINYKNVFWFLIDGLSPDFLNITGNKKVLPNFFDELMEGGTVFSNVATTAAGTHTSMHSIFSSTMPSVNGATGWAKEALQNFNQEIFTVADFLKMAGFNTYRYCDADGERTVPMSGFQVWESSGYIIRDLLDKTNMTKTSRRNKFIERVNSDTNNKFIYHHIELLHELNGKLGSVWKHDDYAKNIAKTSEEFKKLYNEYNIKPEDLVIISSDHGVVLDKDWNEDGIENGERHYEQSVKAFCALISKDIKKQVLGELVSSLDEAPTILKIALDVNMPGQGIDRVKYIEEGICEKRICLREKGTYNAPGELRNPLSSDVFYIKDEDWKYVYGTRDTRCEWLIDLSKDEDYKINLKDKFPELVKKYRKILEDELIYCHEDIKEIYDRHRFNLKKSALKKKFSIIINGGVKWTETQLISLLDLAGPYYELIVIGNKEDIADKYKNNYKIKLIDTKTVNSKSDFIKECAGEWLLFLNKPMEYSEYLLSDLYCKLNDLNENNKVIRFSAGILIRKQKYIVEHGRINKKECIYINSNKIRVKLKNKLYKISLMDILYSMYSYLPIRIKNILKYFLAKVRKG